MSFKSKTKTNKSPNRRYCQNYHLSYTGRFFIFRTYVAPSSGKTISDISVSFIGRVAEMLQIIHLRWTDSWHCFVTFLNKGLSLVLVVYVYHFRMFFYVSIGTIKGYSMCTTRIIWKIKTKGSYIIDKSHYILIKNVRQLH